MTRPIHQENRANMKPEVISVAEMAIAGIEVRTSNSEEANAGTAKIPRLWQRFRQDGIIGRIPGVVPNACPVGVYTRYESDQAGAFTLIAGVQVQDAGVALPDGVTTAIIPSGRYLCFSAHGPMPQVVVQTWGAIWDYFAHAPEHERAYRVDFESYPAPDEVAIHISIR
jgi:predicted transcriptional regulator YdeE